MARDLFEEFGISPQGADSNEPIDLFETFDVKPKDPATWGKTFGALGEMLGEVGTSAAGGMLQSSGERGIQRAKADIEHPEGRIERKMLRRGGPLGIDVGRGVRQIQNPEQETAKAKAEAEAELPVMKRRAGIGRDMFEQSAKRQEEIRPDFTSKDWGKEYVFDLGVAAEKMVPPLVIGATTRNPILATASMGPTVYGDTYGHKRMQGRSIREANQDAIASTAIELGTELPVFGQLFKFGKPGLKKILDTTVLEGVSESVSSLLQTAYDAGVVDDNMTLGEAFTSAKTYQDAAYEGLIGVGLGAMMGGGMIHADLRAERQAIEEIKDITANMQFEVMSDTALEGVIETGEKLAKEHGDTDLSQMLDVLKAEQQLRAENLEKSSAQKDTIEHNQAQKDTIKPEPVKDASPGQPAGFKDLEPEEESGIAGIQLPSTDAGLSTAESGIGYQATSPIKEAGISRIKDKPTPESPAAIEAQMKAFEEGRKPAVLLTPGEGMPALPDGAQVAEIPGRGLLIYKDPAVLELAQNDRMGEALGYGISEKPVSDQVVTARDETGQVVQDVLTDGRPEVVEAAEQVAGDKGTVETRPAMEALQEREQGKGQKIRQIDTKNDSLISMIAKLGGISIEEAAGHGVDPADMKRARHKILPAFTKPGQTRQGGIKGDSFDGIREKLNEHGHSFESETELVNAVMEEMAGSPVYTPEGQEYQAEQAMPKYLQDDAAGEAPTAPVDSKPVKKLTKKALAAMWPDEQWEYDQATMDDVPTPAGVHYDPSWDEETQRIQDLAELASEYADVDELLDSSKADSTIAKELWEIIENGRKSQKGSRVPASTEAAAGTEDQGSKERSDFQLDTQSEKELAEKEAREQDEATATKEQVDKEAEHFTLEQQVDDTPDSAGQGLFTADGRPAQKAIDKAAHEAATSPTNDLQEPTQAQKEAGNYKVGRISLHGLDISIENPKGSKRSGTDSDGESWSVTMKHHYGYIRGTEGKDKDHIDVFLGPGAENAAMPVFVVDQINPHTGSFDEHKVMMGFKNQLAAKRGYLDNYEKGWKGVGAVNKMSLDEFKAWLDSGNTKRAVSYAEPTKKEIPGERHEKTKAADITEMSDEAFELLIDQETTKPKVKKRKLPANIDRLRNYFVPGRIVDAYSGKDRVISFNVPAKESVSNDWDVTVVKVDENGNAIQPERTHATTPSSKKMLAWEKEHPVEESKPEKAPSKLKQKATARAILKKAGSQGVKGADEALAGLAELFGGKGKLSSGFTFDEETYEKAKPHFKAALESFVEAGKSLAEFVKFIVDNFGVGVKPYLLQFHKDVKASKIKVRGINDDADSRTSQAGNSADRADSGRSDQADAANADDGAGRADGDAAIKPGEAGLEPQSDLGLYQPGSDLFGKPGDAGVPAGEGRSGTDGAAAGYEQPGRSADDSAARVPDGTGRSERPGKDAETYHRSLAEKLKLQKAANKIPLTYGDPANIRKTLPFLLPEQQEDVAFAEARYLSGNEPGVLFTNGTGTGKTYTGLGIIKRHMRETGSEDILLVVPAGKVNDWIEDARNLQIKASKLISKKDAGQGVIVTSYQNFQDNWELQGRDFSLIAYDESHYLGQSATGDTMAFDMHQAAANHADGLYWKAWVRDPEAKKLEYSRRKFIKDEIAKIEKMAEDSRLSAKERMVASAELEAKDKLKKRLDKEFRENNKGKYIEIHDRSRDQQEPLKEKYHRSNKVLFLSASPFAYHRSIDYADGYLFSYGENEEKQGYYTITPRDLFFITNFGYRFRYGKLTTPDKDVDVGLMERRFNESLKKSGALSGRTLEVDYDYSREFVIFDSKLGNKVDMGLNVLRGLSPDGEYLNANEMIAAGHPVFKELPDALRSQFTYSYLSQLTEAIKAEGLTDRIKKHLGMGRQVVVFHDFQKTVSKHPFRLGSVSTKHAGTEDQIADANDLLHDEIALFNKHYPDLPKLPLDKLKSVVETITDEFGDRVAVIKGGVSANKKTELIKKYQADDSGIDVIVVQRMSGREGISLHDITGGHQRALIDMGLPIRPVDSLQTEGRVYRYAVMSDAIIEYPVLGTTFERIMFASKVAERSRTAENLAMGNLARDMEKAFKEGYIEAYEFDPNPEQGKGGKERDRTMREDDPWDIAKSLYFGRRKNTKRRDQREGVDYFSTPEPLGLKMVEWAGGRPGERGLEPSAGHGAIARWFPEDTRNVFIDPSSKLSAEVGLLSNGFPETALFEDFPVESKFDFIVMNPPYGSGGATAMQHLDKAMRQLKNGGRIVALLPEGPAADKKLDKLLYGREGEAEELKESAKSGLITGGERDSRLRQLENFHVMADYGLPRVTFERAGTQVKTHIVVIDRYDKPEDVPYRKGRFDIDVDDINEFFDRIQDFNGPQRGEVSTVEENADSEEKPTAAKPETAGVEKKKGFHTKKEIDIWYVHLTGKRIERSDFLALKAKAKALGGYYSIYKGGGAKPGFIFETDENADKFIQEYNDYFGEDSGPRFSRQAKQRGPILSSEELDSILDRITGSWVDGPDVVALDDFSGLPAPIKKAAKEQGASADDVHGVSFLGKVYVIRSMMESRADVERVLFHEAYGHYGLGKLFGEELKTKLNRIYLGIGGSKGLARLAQKHDIDITEYAKGTNKNTNKNANKSMDIESRRALMMEELLTHIAQDSKPSITRVVKEIVGAVRQWLRKRGLVKLGDLSDSEIMYLLKQARHAVQKGNIGKGTANEIRFMVAWHGTEAAVDKFSTDHIGTGEGMQAFGWGLYFAGKKEVADYYRRSLAGKSFDVKREAKKLGIELSPRTQAEVYRQAGTDKDDMRAAKYLQYANSESRQIDQKKLAKLIGAIRKSKKGNLYKVDIDIHENEMLDWDKPLSNQPEHVRDAIKRYWKKIYDEPFNDSITGADVYNDLTEVELSQESASNKLKKIGIRGIQYLDGTSRGSGEGSRNYVIFDDADVSIEARFMRRGKKDRASEELKRKFGMAPKQSGFKQFVEDIREDGFGDLKRHLQDEWTQGALDRFYGIKRAENEFAGPLDASQSGYVATRLSTGLSSIVTATLHYGTPQWREGILQKIPDSKGLLEIFEPVGDEINDWLAWMGAKRADRLMSEGREHNLTEDDIAEGLALADGRESRFQKVADEYAEFMSHILDVAEQAGLIKPGGRKMWEHADYVPFYRMSVDDMFRGAAGPKGRKGLSHQSSGIRKLRGGTGATNDLLENIVMNVTHLLDASLKNNALGKTLRNLKNTGVYDDATMEFKKELIPMNQIKDMVKRHFEEQGWPEHAIDQYLDMMPKEAIDGLRDMWAMKPPQDPDVVRVMINGKARYYRVKDPLLLRAMTQVNTEKSRFLPMEVARTFKRVLTATVTADPSFMLRNFIRDAAHAWTISDDKFTPVVDSVRGAAKTVRLWAKDVDHEAVGGAVDMMFAGGSFLGGYIHGNDPTQTAAAIRAALRKRGYSASSVNEFMGTLIDTPAKYWEKYREFGDAIENASREAVYEAGIKADKSKAQAIFDAKDLMDYSMQGQWALFQALGDVVPFFNARLQGLYKLKRAGAIPGWASKSKVLAKGGVITALSLALMALNWDDERYEELEDWDKDLYWHFWIDGEHFRIPKPFEVGVIYGTIPERMARYFGKKDDEKQAMKQLLWNIRESLNLVQMPQIGKPVAELWANKNTFTEQNIEGMADEGKLKSARYNEHTSLTMRKLGEAFGDDINLSPKQMEHLWRGYLGTLGMYALGATDLAVHWASDGPTKPDYRPDQLPIIKSFYRGDDPARNTRYKTEMYEMLRELEQVNRTIRSYAKQGRKDEARALKNEKSDQLKALGPLRAGAKGAKSIRVKIDRIIRDEDMSGAEKREKINKLYVKANKLTKKMVEKAYPHYISD